MSNNMRDRFVSSNFDEVDLVLDTDRRFDEAIAAADAGEYDLIKVIVNNLEESGKICSSSIEREDAIEYNPEDDDASGILDTTAEDIREYVSNQEYDDDDGEMIDCIMGGETMSIDYDEDDDF